MTEKQKILKPKRDAHFIECALTGEVFTGNVTPLRFFLKDGILDVSLTNKKIVGAVFVNPDPFLINNLISGRRSIDCFPNDVFDDKLVGQIIDIYKNKIYSSLGFLLKSGQAVVGRMAIDRAIMGTHEAMPIALLITHDASQKIVKNFTNRMPGLQVIQNFNKEWLRTITGREKISYYCVLSSNMGKNLLKDYQNFLKFMND